MWKRITLSRKVKVVKLGIKEERELEKGYKYSSKASYSRRCHVILLKSKGYTSKDIASIFEIGEQSVNKWVKRFLSEGVEGLQTKSGQGRPRILDSGKDAEKVREIVKRERQRLKLAKEELESTLDKEFSMSTLTRFLKLLAAPTDEFG